MMISLSLSVQRLPTRSPKPAGRPSIDALLAESVLVAPAAIRFFFPKASLLATASDLQGLGPLWALNASQQKEFWLAMAEWTAVAAVRPWQVESLDQASLAVAGVSKGNSHVRTIGGSPVLMNFIPDGGAFQSGGFEQGTILHEIGHAFGLKHPFEGNPILTGVEDGAHYTIMSYDSWSDGQGRLIGPATPQLYDIQAVQYLYGANQSHRAGNDVYRWNPNAIIFRCLWDAGGSDTIDASNQPQSVRIDLAPGSFSRIGREIVQSVFVADPKGSSTRTTTTTVNGVTTQVVERGTYVDKRRRDNLSIAFGAVIENAIGTAFADELRGNGAANVLDGRGGDDRLAGGLGNDWYVFDADTRLGRDVLQETAVASGGIDTISFRGTSRQTIRLDLATTVVQRVNDNLQISLAAAEGFENISGGELGDDLRGNSQANVLLGAGGRDLLTGREGKDLLDGGMGRDTLKGGGDADRFRFTTAPDPLGDCDVITDFSRAQGDRIELDNAVFPRLPATGILAATAFHAGTAAITAEQRILHNRAAGLLSYDPDGKGALAPLPLARITPGLVLAASCFVVV